MNKTKSQKAAQGAAGGRNVYYTQFMLITYESVGQNKHNEAIVLLELYQYWGAQGIFFPPHTSQIINYLILQEHPTCGQVAFSEIQYNLRKYYILACWW